MDYWRESVECALADAGVEASADQIEQITGAIEGAHENYGMAHGHHCIPNPLLSENEKLEQALQAERDKVHCKECGGQGSITTHGPIHSGTSQCWKCRGEGRHAP